MHGVRTVTATRYVTPLREGGSLPAIIEADDDGMYVLKFRGAGQGPKVLVAELLAGEIARAAGLPVPEIVFVELDPDLARTEPDPEIQDLIKASAGLNLALDYLPGAVTFDPVVHAIEPSLASRIVWFDALVSNVDRSTRNPNLMLWHRRLWLIDHGAALYAHHDWSRVDEVRTRAPFPLIADHVLLGVADDPREVDAEAAARLLGHRGEVDPWNGTVDTGHIDGLGAPRPGGHVEQAGARRGGQLGHHLVGQPPEQQLLEPGPPTGRLPDLGFVPGEPPQLGERRHRVDGHTGAGVQIAGAAGIDVVGPGDLAGRRGAGCRGDGRGRELLQAAAELFSTSGARGTSVAAVAARVGITDAGVLSSHVPGGHRG